MTGIIGKIPSRSKLVLPFATVDQGGTGASTLTDGGILLGSGSGAVTATAALADSEMLVGDGTTDPAIESGATLRTSIGLGNVDNVADASQVSVGALNSGSITSGFGTINTGSSTITTTGAIAGATVNTGQGANELYDMDQNVLTSSSPTFAGFGGNAGEKTAKAWVNFNGNGAGIRDSFNVSSISDGTPAGEHVVNFAVALPDANYAVATAVAFVAAGNGPQAHVNLHRYSSSGNESAPTTGGFRITCANSSGTSADMKYVNSVIF